MIKDAKCGICGLPMPEGEETFKYHGYSGPCPVTEERSGPETVNHPKHYNSGKIEVIEFLEDQKLDFHCANAVKYICRAGRKDPTKEVEDLKKAIWYLQRKIEVLSPDPRRPNDMNCRHLGKYSDGICRDCGATV